MTIYIEIRDKDGGNRIATEFELDEPYLKAFKPLNRNREIPFDLRAQEEAAEQESARWNVARIVRERFEKLLAHNDTHFGYPPDHSRHSA